MELVGMAAVGLLLCCLMSFVPPQLHAQNIQALRTCWTCPASGPWLCHANAVMWICSVCGNRSAMLWLC